MDKLDKPLACPTHGKWLELMEKRWEVNRAKAGLCSLFILRVNTYITKCYLSFPFPSMEGRGGGGTGVEVLEGNT